MSDTPSGIKSEHEWCVYHRALDGGGIFYERHGRTRVRGLFFKTMQLQVQNNLITTQESGLHTYQ